MLSNAISWTGKGQYSVAANVVGRWSQFIRISSWASILHPSRLAAPRQTDAASSMKPPKSSLQQSFPTFWFVVYFAVVIARVFARVIKQQYAILLSHDSYCSKIFAKERGFGLIMTWVFSEWKWGRRKWIALAVAFWAKVGQGKHAIRIRHYCNNKFKS